jgi:dGTPase
MAADSAAALASLRAFNYERIYVRPESLAQSQAVVRVLQALVEHFVARPDLLPATAVADDAAPGDDPVRAAVTYVAGMTDRYAFDLAVRDLGWDPDRLPLRTNG